MWTTSDGTQQFQSSTTLRSPPRKQRQTPSHLRCGHHRLTAFDIRSHTTTAKQPEQCAGKFGFGKKGDADGENEYAENRGKEGGEAAVGNSSIGI